MTTAQKRPREPEAPDASGMTVLHRARLVPWAVSPVTSIAAAPDGSVVAAGYEDGKVEVFEASLLHCVARIPGADAREISSLAWARPPGERAWRLFAATLDGQLLELSPSSLGLLAAADSCGGPVWCLRAAPAGPDGSVSRLAAACSDGSVKLFSVAAGERGAQFERSLPGVEGLALSLAWAPDGASLVSGGSDGCIHTWDVAQGTELRRTTVGSSSTSPPCVWALAVLPDGTVVSGDQEGAVQFWDAHFGTLLSRHQQAVADVLALAASPEGQTVWAAGVDPRVSVYQLVPDRASGGTRWVFLDRKQPHTHDVRCLAALQRPDADPLLLSGGNDGQVVLYSMPRFLKEHPTRQSKAPQRPLLELAAAVRPGLLLHAAGRKLELWQLGRAVVQQHVLATAPGRWEGDPWEIDMLPVHLADITSSSSSSGHIISAALARDGSAVAASDGGRLRLFRLAHGSADAAAGGTTAAGGEDAAAPQLVVTRIKVQAELDAPVVCCTFSALGHCLYAATASGRVLAVDAASGELLASLQLPPPGAPAPAKAPQQRAQQQQQQQLPQQQPQQQPPPQQQQQPQQQQGGGGEPLAQQPPQAQLDKAAWCTALAWVMPAITHLAASPDGRLLAVATPGGVQLLATGRGAKCWLAPRLQLQLLGEPAPVSALAFSGNSRLLAVATAANSVAVYHVDSGLPTQWSLANMQQLTELLQSLPGSIAGLSFRPSAADPLCLIAWSPGGLCFFDMALPLTPEPPGAKQHRVARHQANVATEPNPLSLPGRNGRMLPLQNCCLAMGYLSASEAMLVEKPWQDVLLGLLPPLVRHRYGM